MLLHRKKVGREGREGQCEYLIIYVGPKTQLSRVLWGWRFEFEPLFTYSSMFIKMTSFDLKY